MYVCMFPKQAQLVGVLEDIEDGRVSAPGLFSVSVPGDASGCFGGLSWMVEKGWL